jgi:hypothetical protein
MKILSPTGVVMPPRDYVTVETPEDAFPRLVPVTYWFKPGERERFESPRLPWAVYNSFLREFLRSR